jgi:hypothetical protein
MAASGPADLTTQQVTKAFADQGFTVSIDPKLDQQDLDADPEQTKLLYEDSWYQLLNARGHPKEFNALGKNVFYVDGYVSCVVVEKPPFRLTAHKILDLVEYGSSLIKIPSRNTACSFFVTADPKSDSKAKAKLPAKRIKAFKRAIKNLEDESQ